MADSVKETMEEIHSDLSLAAEYESDYHYTLTDDGRIEVRRYAEDGTLYGVFGHLNFVEVK